MKKIVALMLLSLACAVLLSGCGTSPTDNEEQALKVYSFSGENEYVSVSNGVIILDGKDKYHIHPGFSPQIELVNTDLHETHIELEQTKHYKQIDDRSK